MMDRTTTLVRFSCYENNVCERGFDEFLRLDTYVLEVTSACLTHV